MIVKQATDRATFSTQKMGKSDLARGRHLFAGLNAFEPGQTHEPHAHCDRDKLYVVMQGRGELTIGDETQSVGPGDVDRGARHRFLREGPGPEGTPPIRA